MSTDVSTAESSGRADAAADAAPTVVIRVNDPNPPDTGIRLPVIRVPARQLVEQAQERAEAAEARARAAEARAEAAEARAAAEARPAQARASAAPGCDTHHLPSDPVVLQHLVVELQAALSAQRQRVAELEAAMEDLLRRLYRTPREHWDPNQPLLFPDIHPDALATAADTPTVPEVPAEPEAATKRKKAKGKPHGRRRLEELLPHLPKERLEHTLTEAERICPHCGKVRAHIGEQLSHQAEYYPARLVHVEHAQFTYSCRDCPEHIVTAPKPPQIIDRCLAGPALLAHVTSSKFDDFLPLYRQELILSRCGLFLARSTLCGWLADLAQALQPLVQRMRDVLFQSRVIQTDGTLIDVLMEGQRQTQTGYFWPYLGDYDHPVVVVDFSLDKTKEHPQRFLDPYTGYVQADAYAAYNGCFLPDSPKPKTEVGCWSHTEGYYDDARDSDPLLACQALAFIQALFAIEADAQRDHLAEAALLALRQRQAVPILNDFKVWLDDAQPRVLPKSPMGQAIGYTLNQWTALNRYTEAGFLPIDNNATERINKLIARGRVNWLFVGSPKGGETAATLLSLVLTCRRLHMDSFLYLRDLFTRWPAHPRERLDELLPHRWLAEHPEARHPPQRQGHGHGDPQPRRRRRSGDVNRPPPA